MAGATRFIGRQRDLAELDESLGRARLVTLVGPAGIGKTRLALRLGETTRDKWEQGVWTFLLESARTADEVAAAVGKVLGVPDGADAIERVGMAMAARGRSLFVFDNLEQALPAAAPVVAGWLEAAPDARFVVTSRETLRVSAEHVYEVLPLPEAVELFVDRARAQRRSGPARWEPDAAELGRIAEIAARLDQIPLAVELAAARARVLSTAQLLDRLRDRLELLSSGQRDRPRRQSGLRAALEWSWDLLDERERAGLAALGVVRGHASLSLAETLVAPDEDRAGGLAIVEALCDKSLVRRLPDGRLALYDTIADFARERLASSGRTAAAAARYERWVLARADELLSSVRRDPDVATAALSAEADHLRACLDLGATRSDPLGVETALRAAVALDESSAGEGVAHRDLDPLDRALERARGSVAPALLGRALVARARKRSFLGRHDEAEADCREALALCTDGSHPELESAARRLLGGLLFGRGRGEHVEHEAARARTVAQSLGDLRGELLGLQLEASSLQSRGLGEDAIERFERSLALARRARFARGEAAAHAGIAFYHLERGDHARAREHYERCLAIAREAGANRFAMLVTGYLGLTALDEDRPVDAAERLAAAVAEAREYGDTRAEGIFSALEGAARACVDEIAEAEGLFDTAEAHLAAHSLFQDVASIHRGHLDLARARRAAAAGDLEAWNRHRAAARGRADLARSSRGRTPQLVDVSDDARLAQRILDRALGRASASAPAQQSRQVALSLHVSLDASTFRLGGGDPVDLSRRSVLRSLLSALADQHALSPGVPLSLKQLLAAGWPNERVQRSAALNRLHVALSTLRSLGLREILERRADGYLLDPRTTLTR